MRRWVNGSTPSTRISSRSPATSSPSGPDYVETVAERLAELRAPDGVYGCMGNHDYFTDGEAFARVLEAPRPGPAPQPRPAPAARGADAIFLAGVDDTWTGKANLGQALRERPAGMPVVLLAHDPALFARAAASGVALTLSGHTHGGQLAFPLAPRRWNLARFMTPFTTGHYRVGEAHLYVNRGLGTTGPPIRIGARPEITIITLVPSRVDLVERLQHIAEDVIREVSIPPNPLGG